MAGIHAIIGIGEAIITTTAVSLILKTRPDLVISYVTPILPSPSRGEVGTTRNRGEGEGKEVVYEKTV
jgi:hypothetical protein